MLALGLATPAGAQSGPSAPPAAARAQMPDAPPVVREPGARPAPGSVEDSLWLASRDAEAEAMRSAVRIEDAALRDYVRTVQCRVAPQHCADIRVQVFRRPAFNAFVMPNGYTEVWSGLLLRVRNEAQLAFVLGHEAAHYTGNHSLRQWETVKRTQGALLALNIAASAAATFDASYVDYGRYVDVLATAAYVGALAGLFAFSREFEEEADSVGQGWMAAAGYDPAEAARVWQTVIRLDGASDSERIRRSESRGSVFRTHPLSRARLAALEARAPRLASDRTRAGQDEATYRAVIRPFLQDWLRDEMRRRDFGATLALLDDLKPGGDAGVIGYFEGEVYRLRRQPGDEARAIAAYRAATAAPDGPVEAWRELGTSLNRVADRAGARAALQAYLDRAPDAPDRALIQRQLDRLAAAPAPPDAATPPAAAPAGRPAQGPDR